MKWKIAVFFTLLFSKSFAIDTTNSIDLYSYVYIDSSGIDIDVKNLILDHGTLGLEEVSKITETIEIKSLAPDEVIPEGKRISISLIASEIDKNKLTLDVDSTQQIPHLLLANIKTGRENREIKIFDEQIKDEVIVAGTNQVITVDISSVVFFKDTENKLNGNYKNISTISIAMLVD